MNYSLARSQRKTLAIHIMTDGSVEVRAPFRLAKSEIDRFVASKAAWITQKQALIAERQTTGMQTLPSSEYTSGEFRRTVRELTATWSERLGVLTAFVGIRRMSSRWGSCTAETRRIRLNAALEYCPRECLEYVVVHELTHMRENNHSPQVCQGGICGYIEILWTCRLRLIFFESICNLRNNVI